MEQTATVHWDCEAVQLLRKTVWKHFEQLKIPLQYDSTNTSLGFYHELKTFSYKNLYTDVINSFIQLPCHSWKMFFATEKLPPDNAMEVNSEK